MSCLFCDIVAGKIPADIVHETEDVLAFRDIAPQAPVHLLFIPKAHISSCHEQSVLSSRLYPAIFEAIRETAATLDIAKNGYRVVTNVGSDGGQTVSHLHFHMLGGRKMNWPPG